MGKVKKSIPVYDLCAVNPQGINHEISAGPFADYLIIRNKLIIPHRHEGYYHVVLFTGGTGTVTIDFEQFDLFPGRIYFMVPGQVHCWDLSEEKDGFALNFSERVFSSFMDNAQYLDQFPFLSGIPNHSVIDLNEENLSEAKFFIGQIIKEISEKDNFSLDKACFHLISLFISISRHHDISVRKLVPDQKQTILMNFRRLVNKYYAEKKLPRDYAHMLFVTPNRLNTITNELTGRSAGEIIRDRILLEAKRLLVNADMSIAEIAFKLNFTDNSYFTKFFKKYAGVTPEDFKTLYSL